MTEQEEARIIRALDRLNKDWPGGLTLASMGGTLCLCRSAEMYEWPDNHRGNTEGVNPDSVIWSSVSIPNTGGDW